MSYRSSYKSSSSYQRYSTDGSSNLSSSRIRSSIAADDDLPLTSSYSTRRTSNYETSSSNYGRTGLSGTGDDDFGSSSSRRSYQASSRLASHYSTDNDYDLDSTSRYSSTTASKYKISAISSDEDELGSLSSARKYSRFSSRDEGDNITSTSRLSRYSSLEGSTRATAIDDDDFGTYSTRRRTSRLSYLNEDDDLPTTTYSRQSSYKPSYEVTTPGIDDDLVKGYSFDSSSDRRSKYQRRESSNLSTSLSRMDSKDVPANQIYEVILDYKPPRSALDEICLKEGQEVIVLSKDKPHKWKVRTRRSKNFRTVEEGFAPSAYLKPTNEKASDAEIGVIASETTTPTTEEAKPKFESKDLNKKKDMIVRELIETEEDLIRDMQFVLRTYIRQSESSITPKEIKSVKNDLFNCFKELLEFHKNVLLKNFQTLSKEPTKIGTLFLKIKSDFNNHTKYCQNLPKAVQILEDNSDVYEYFNNYAVKIRDEKQLSEHLKLPLQRLNDYQLLLKELSKNLARMDEDVGDIEKAIQFIASIPDLEQIESDVEDTNEKNKDKKDEIDKENQRPNIDLMNPPDSAEIRTENIMSAFKLADFNLPTGSTEKLSNLLKNVLQAKDFFDVIDSDGSRKERFIFFFKSRMFITEINKNIGQDQRTYNVDRIIKLPEVNIYDEDPNTLIIISKDSKDPNFPIWLKCADEKRIKAWLNIINSLPKTEESDEIFDENTNKLFAQDNQPKTPTTTSPQQQQSKEEKMEVDENNNDKLSKKKSFDKSEDESAPKKKKSVNEKQPDSKRKAADSESELEPKEKPKRPSLEIPDITPKRKIEVDENVIEPKKVLTLSASENKIPETLNSDNFEIISDLKSVTKPYGDTATLQCEVSPGTVNVQWLKDNQVLRNKNHHTYKKGNVYFLEIRDLQPEDTGIYTFVASNSKKSLASSSSLNVLLDDSRPTSPGGSFLPHPPKFKVALKDTELLEGATVRFELIVRGLPIPSITVYKDNKILKEDDHLKIQFQSKEVFEIVIEKVKLEDAGLYRCVAVNMEGEAETSARITVSKNKDVFWGIDHEASVERYMSPRATSPTFKWFKDGKEFEASERFQVQYDEDEDTVCLIFQHVTPDDAGLYTCVAATSSGKISCNAELNVQGVLSQLPREPMAPKIMKELQNVEVSKGQSVAMLEAQISGFPKPQITWYKEDRKLEASDHIKMFTEGEDNFTLMIKNVSEDDAGKYKLQAQNKLGLTESDAELIIVKQPKFESTEDKIEIDDNQTLIIEQKYEAVPKPEVQWMKDGQKIKESDRIKSCIEEQKRIVRLTVEKATSEDAGHYQCLISNSLGQAKHDTSVVVKAKPKFLSKFEAIEVEEHGTAIFKAQSAPGPRIIELYKEDKLLKIGERIQLKEEQDGKFQLIIKDCNEEDSGTYKCKIKNDYGYDEDEASLVVRKQVKAPDFKEPLKNMEVNLNDENVKLAVKIEGEPKPNVKWLKDGKPIEEQKDLFKIVNDDQGSTLIIPKVLHDHQGKYQCISENAQGKKETSSVLNVKYAPYVVKHLENVDTALGMEAELKAVIKGFPKPIIKWSCNDAEMAIMGGRKQYSYDEDSAQYSLLIKKFQADDIGQYSIEAENELGCCQSSAKIQLASKPLFSKVLKNTTVKEMEANTEMVVQLNKETGKPLVKWYKDDQEIKDDNTNYRKVEDKLDNSYKLVILKATEETVGKYKCVAANDFGSTETAARFDIITKPRFVKGLCDMEVPEGNNVSLTVQLAGFPKPEVVFLKDGEEISAEAKIQIKKEMDDIYQLEIENIRIIMSGEYECRIRNEAGEASSKGVITVNSKPQFLKDLTDQLVAKGDDIVLEVVVTGKPDPELRWFVNGKETTGDKRILYDNREEQYTVKIPSAQESDAGVYHCIAQNKFGETRSQDANVQVKSAESTPTFQKKIVDTEVVVNDNVRFETSVSGEPKPEISWSKNSVPLKPGQNVIMQSDGQNHILILKNLQKADSGVITCKAENAAGCVTQQANLDVEEPVIPTISPLKDQKVVEGEPLKIEAKIEGFPRPIVEWTKDGKPVDEEMVVSNPKNNQYGLELKPITSKSVGTYTCTATNCAGKVEESFAVNITGKKPVFIKELEETEIVMSVDKQNTRLKLGQSAIFETIVDGIPDPEVKWLKNDKELKPGGRVVIEDLEGAHRLEIKNITKEDVAKYSCKATNQYGEVETVCLLKFLNEPHEPIIKKPLEDIKIEEGEDLKLFCRVDGEPMPAVRWLKDDKPLEDNNRVQLTSKRDGSTCLVIEKTNLADSGIYKVEAENAKGVCRSQATVLISKPQRPPAIQKPLKEEVKLEFNEPLVLEAEIFGLPIPTVQWSKDGKPLKDDSRIKIQQTDDGKCKLKIDHVKPEDAGKYTLLATNENGQIATSSDVAVAPEPYAPLVLDNLPVQIQVAIGEPIEIKSKIQAYPVAKVQWLKDKKPLQDSDRVKIINTDDGQTCLQISNAQPDDQATYDLVAENSAGEMSLSTKVQVLKPQEEESILAKDKKNDLSKKPEEVKAEIVKDDAANKGKMDDDKQKLSDVDKLKPQENEALLVKEKAKPSTDEVSDELKIEKSMPNQQNIATGENLQLTMKLTAKPTTIEDIKIFKDDQQIKQNELNEIKINDNGEIVFSHKQCEPMDSGMYRIEVQTPTKSLSNSCLVNVSEDLKKKPTESKLKFKESLTDMNVPSGSPTRLQCVIDGNPSDLNITWFKDGEELLPNEHYGFVREPNGTIALLIDSFSAKDQGKYEVKVSSPDGKISSDNKVTMKSDDSSKEKPKIVEGLQDTTVQEGSQLALKCQIAPTATPTKCKWFFNGQELKESDQIKFIEFPDGIFMLQVKDVAMANTGAYKVVFTNDSGDSTSEAKVNIEKKKVKEPKMIKGLQAVELIAGEPGFIEFQVDKLDDGSDGDDIKFLLEKQHVIPDDRIHLQKLPDGVIRLNFDEVKLEDGGNYTAIFKNDGGTTQSSGLVTVKSKPIIKRPLDDFLVKEKCSAKFEAQIVGNPTPEIKWLKNGSSISIDGKHYTTSKSDDNTYVLTINDCTLRDKGEYTIKATNDLGQAISKGNLTIATSSEFEESAPTFTDNLQNLTAGKGDEVVFKAKIKAHPVPKIVWKKDGQEINSQMNPEKILTTFNGEDLQLTILNFCDSDIGSYEVYVENNLGEASSSATLKERDGFKPKFTKTLSKDASGNFKTPFKLSCKVDGYPQPEVQWFFNDKPIEVGSSKYNVGKEFGEHFLTIFDPTDADSGIYRCVAKNSYGSDSTESNVLFGEKDKEAAQFIEKLQDYDVLPGATAYFNACVIGNPKPEFKWFKDDKEIKIDGEKYFFNCNENGMITFEIRNVTDGDLGKYRCNASNIIGSDNSICQLNFETVDGLNRMNQKHKSMKSQQRAKEMANEIQFQTSGLPKALTEKPVITKMIDNSLTLLWVPSIPEQPRFPVSYVVEFSKISDDTWNVCQGNIKDCKCDVVGLEAFEDYAFRVRVENKFGTSEPSPQATAFRSQLKDRETLDKFKKETKPDDFALKHAPPEKIAAAPEFVRDEQSFMYGTIGQPATIEFWVYGYPEPNITWFFEENKLEDQTRFKFLKDRNGRTCLFINKLQESDFGYFTCLAKNEHGEQKKTIKMVKADPPKFTKIFDETSAMSRGHFRLQVSFTGSPEPIVKWFKDFQPLHDTSRIKVLRDSTDTSTLVINDAIARDTGLYSCTVTNVAGTTTTSAYVTVKDQEITFDKYPSSYKEAVKPKNKKLEQYFDIGDELGRGTQGITYHVVERETGKSFAAKMMHGGGEMRQYMTQELDIMNQLGVNEKLVQLFDCYSATPYSTSLVMGLSGGGNLLDHCLKQGSLTEQQVADYIRQILEGLQHMHYKNIGHFGLTIGDILMARINGNDITICDFGLAARVPPGACHYVEFGQPEFVSPEIVNKNSVTLTADTWSVGVIAHILLTGISPFFGEHDKATLQNIQNKNLDLSDDKLGHISEHGRDFLRKALNFDQHNRMDIKTALNHPWIKNYEHSAPKTDLEIMNKLREYKTQSDRWYKNAACRHYYRRRQLHSCYTHPSRMIYPPDEQYSPLVSPEREMKRFTRNVAPFENIYPKTRPLGPEEIIKESQYQCGPDTYLLQLRDTDFPARIRKYLRIAATNSPLMASNLRQSHWARYSRDYTLTMPGSFAQVSVKERRKFTDIMDEEIQEEKTGSMGRKPRRLAREVGTPLYHHGQWKQLRKETGISKPEPIDDTDHIPPFFREKLKDQSFSSGDNVVMTCYAVGTPAPTYTWFRNDSIIIETNRTKVKRMDDGSCKLILEPSKDYDIGIYKCVARNSQGSVVCRAKLSIGDVPGSINPPTIKDFASTECLIEWSSPLRQLADCFVKHYKLEFKKADDTQWTVLEPEIKQEYYHAKNLEPNQSYQFRITAFNKFGASEPSGPSDEIKTLDSSDSKTITIPKSMLFECHSANVNDGDVDYSNKIDYNIENTQIPLIKSEYKDLYDFKSIITTGKFSVIAKTYIKDGSKKLLACKCVLQQSEQESSINNEYEIAKTLVHEKIANLQYANRDGNLFTLAMDLGCGLNVLTYLSRRQSYTEQHVANILCQVLDAIEYLHFRGIALLELQPDNVILVNEQSLSIKLVDFANARYVNNNSNSNATKLSILANPEFVAPEIIRNEGPSLPYTDVWCVGVLAYILLSGHSPFKGVDQQETAQNVVFVRYLFERLYPKVTQEAIRFLLSVFKLTAHKRPTIEECLESKWLLPNDFMMRKRETAIFETKQIQNYTENYLMDKTSVQHSRLLDLIGLSQ